MKISKIVLALLIISVSLISSSCKKYVDGPKISFRSKKARFTGDWSLDKISFNGTDQTSAYAGYKLKTDKGGSFTETENGTTSTGKWTLGEDKDDAYLTYDNISSSVPPTSYRILRLKNKELWMKHTEPNGDVTEVHLKQ